MVGKEPSSEASHQTTRLGPGRHRGPGEVVCVMELSSMLAGERFSDRPKSVCPLIGAVLRTYNDNVDDSRRQDLYRFAAEAVGSRGDYALERARVEVALDAAREAMPRRPEPARDAGPEEIAEYVVESMARRAYSRYRSRRWDDASHEQMLGLVRRLIAIGGSSFEALLGELVEHPRETVEDGGRDEELFIAELGHGGAEAWLESSLAFLDEDASPFGEGGHDYAPVAVGAGALYEAVVDEPVEHFGHAGWPQIGGDGEFSAGHLHAVAQAEEQAELRVTELARPVELTPAHPPKRGHRTLERSAQLLSAAAFVALAYDARRRAR
jgi:hypothetical protein